MGLMASKNVYDGSPLGWRELALAFAAMDFDYIESIAKTAKYKHVLKRLAQLAINMSQGYDDAASGYIQDTLEILEQRGIIEYRVEEGWAII